MHINMNKYSSLNLASFLLSIHLYIIRFLSCRLPVCDQQPAAAALDEGNSNI